MAQRGQANTAISRSRFVFRAQVLLLVDLFEREIEERVYGALAGILGNCAEQAEKTGVFDIERVLPVWKAPDEPILIRRHLSRLEFYSEFESCLDHFVDTEPGDPKVIPWSDYSGLGIYPDHPGSASKARQQVWHTDSARS
jgi:hypothetical protein